MIQNNLLKWDARSSLQEVGFLLQCSQTLTSRALSLQRRPLLDKHEGRLFVFLNCASLQLDCQPRRKMQQCKSGKVIERALLKSLLPAIAANPDWQKWIGVLGRASSVVFDKASKKEKKPKCVVCTMPFENYLLLVLHLELLHKEHLQVLKYEFVQESILISTLPCQEIDLNSPQDFYYQGGLADYALKLSYGVRIQQVMSGIFGKFSRRATSHKKEYFHSLDVFRQVGAESEEEDSEAEVGQIEQELERMRISDFTDVNDFDKHFFLKWNDAVRQAKRQNVYLSEPVMRDLLRSFAKKAKQEKIRRINLLMHAWTLWSTGRIDASDVTNLLLDYDRAPE